MRTYDVWSGVFILISLLVAFTLLAITIYDSVLGYDGDLLLRSLFVKKGTVAPPPPPPPKSLTVIGAIFKVLFTRIN